ncbi:HAD-like domain-containing protein, partial [Coemansia spiralis]
VGAFAFFDPPQREARPVLQECQEAGIRVIVATGDHPSTALAVANAVGIAESQPQHFPEGNNGSVRHTADSNVFARITPAQKLRLVHALQARGEVVAFIGDGINDAPALLRADVGICMGGNPSTADVAMDAASLIVL